MVVHLLKESSGAIEFRYDLEWLDRSRAFPVSRFDRVWSDGRLIGLPQEDCCQALSVPPTRKCQADHGPGMLAIAELLKGADSPAEDHRTLFEAQLVFWLIGATDGHAKNFSIFLHPGGGYALTPLYDVLAAQPSLDARQIERKRMKLAMSVGNNNHYLIDEIQARHFFQTGEAAGLSPSLVRSAVEGIAARMAGALASLEGELPGDFPPALHESVSAGVQRRVRVLEAGLETWPGKLQRTFDRKPAAQGRGGHTLDKARTSPAHAEIG